MFSNVYTQSSKRNPNICKKQSRMVWKWESIEYSATILERFPLSKDCLASSTWFHSFFKLSKSLYLLSRSPFLSANTHFVSYNHSFFSTPSFQNDSSLLVFPFNHFLLLKASTNSIMDCSTKKSPSSTTTMSR